MSSTVIGINGLNQAGPAQKSLQLWGGEGVGSLRTR